MNNELLVIDLSVCKNSGDIISNVSNALEASVGGHNSITIKLSDISLNQSQLMSIQSLILSYDAKLEQVETSNEVTIEACRALSIETVKPKEPQVVQPKVEVSPSIEVAQPSESFKPFETPVLESQRPIETYKKGYDEKDEPHTEEVDYFAPATDEPVVVDEHKTVYVKQTLRSGQVLDFDGNIIIIGDCHPGSEVKASGDITVWGVLGGIAHAGSNGNKDAKIRALKMNAVQLRIADCYSRRPDGTNIPYIIKSSIFTPEEARIVDEGIVLFKIN